MTELAVFEDAGWRNLLPLTWWRAAFDLRCGLDSLLDKIERVCGARAGLLVRPDLAAVIAARQERVVNSIDAVRPKLFVNGRLLLRAPIELPVGVAAWRGDTLLAAHVQTAFASKLTPDVLLDAELTRQALAGVGHETLPAESFELIDYVWQLVHANPGELRRQIGGASRQRLGRVYAGAHLLNEGEIHVATGAKVKPAAVLDAEGGPIYIAENATVSPNVTIQGPCYIGPNTLIQPASLIREGTSIGAWCKVGGEVEGTIIHGYSNKQHYGFLGHAYVGEWVNLGAGTVNSDLKNTYGSVRVAVNGQSIDTGHMFVGSFIGDHAKTGINVALPTGCVIGFAANVFLSRYPEKFVPSFAWQTDERCSVYDPQRALAVAKKAMSRRKVEMSPAEEHAFIQIAKAAPGIEVG